MPGCTYYFNKGQMKSECYNLKNLINFCPGRLFRLGTLSTHLSRVALRMIKTNHMYLVFKTFQGRNLSNLFGGIWKIDGFQNTFWNYLTFSKERKKRDGRRKKNSFQDKKTSWKCTCVSSFTFKNYLSYFFFLLFNKSWVFACHEVLKMLVLRDIHKCFILYNLLINWTFSWRWSWNKSAYSLSNKNCKNLS